MWASNSSIGHGTWESHGTKFKGNVFAVYATCLAGFPAIFSPLWNNHRIRPKWWSNSTESGYRAAWSSLSHHQVLSRQISCFHLDVILIREPYVKTIWQDYISLFPHFLMERCPKREKGDVFSHPKVGGSNPKCHHAATSSIPAITFYVATNNF